MDGYEQFTCCGGTIIGIEFLSFFRQFFRESLNEGRLSLLVSNISLEILKIGTQFD